MGTIREYYRKKDGKTTYHAEVRLKGFDPKRASFPARELAEEWIASVEAACYDVRDEQEVTVRFNWALHEIRSLYDLPFSQLVAKAQRIHLANHNATEVQLCQLISIKTGGCSEDCGYCAQSSKHASSVKASPLMSVAEVVTIAKDAKTKGVSRLCMGAAWRQVRTNPQFERVLEMVKEVSALGLEVCCTLGILDQEQIERLKQAGLYAYNHNLDTSSDHYPKIVTSHTYQDRLDTLDRVADAGVSVCCGGIIGMGESVDDRLKLLQTLACRDPHPESAPLNLLMPMNGTPLENQSPPSVIEFVRLIAVARILMPKAMVRLAAGRLSLTSGEQALCFLAGANSIFVGERLLTAPNPEPEADHGLLEELGMKPKEAAHREATFLTDRLQRLDEKGITRSLTFREPDLIDFASNDYLGLAQSVDLAQEIKERFEELGLKEGIRPGIGATGSRLLTGNYPYLEDLEHTIAAYHGGEAALLFNSGYSANTGLLSCIANENDAILLDSQVHASSWDGARLSRAKNYVFPHNDLNGLEKQLKRAKEGHRELFVCIESLYSMAGDVAPLNEIATLCRRYNAWMIVDEAHATGIMGSEGRGGASELRDSSCLLARVFTFGKGLGVHGAAIVGSTTLRRYLINHCRTFIYTTAFPLHTLVSIRTVYDHLSSLTDQRTHLTSLIRYFQLQMSRSPLPIRTTSTVIQAIPIGNASEVVGISQRLRQQGVDVRAIRSPTVRAGDEMLRVCLHAFNTHQEIDQLMTALSNEREEVFIA